MSLLTTTLPEELDFYIFHHLDETSLKMCLDVSRDCREFVIQSPPLMKKLPVIFNTKNWPSKIPFVAKYGDCVRVVKFRDCKFRSERQFIDILKMTSNAEEIVLQYETDVSEFDPLAVDLAENLESMFNEAMEEVDCLELNEPEQPEEELVLRNLRKVSLDLVQELSAFTRALKSVTSIRTLKITHFNDLHLKQFLIQQNLLKILIIESLWDEIIPTLFANDFAARINFKLKIFYINLNMDQDENFFDFLQSQSSSLEELYVKEVNLDFLRFIHRNLRNLKKLSFFIGALINDRMDEIKNLRMLSVVELTLDCSNTRDSTAVKTLLGMFPNLEVLKAKSHQSLTLPGILESSPKLRKLDLEPFRMEMITLGKSSSLVDLEVHSVAPFLVSLFLPKLAEDCPNIERLVIDGINMDEQEETVNADVANILENLKTFKKLKFCEIINITNCISNMLNLLNHRDDSDAETEEKKLPLQEHELFRFLLENNRDRPAKLSITNYFNTTHADAIRQIVDDLKVAEVIAINKPVQSFDNQPKNLYNLNI